MMSAAIWYVGVISFSRTSLGTSASLIPLYLKQTGDHNGALMQNFTLNVQCQL